MPLYSLTRDKVDELKAKITAKQEQVNELENATVASLWTKELDRFAEAYRKELNAKGLSAEPTKMTEELEPVPAYVKPKPLPTMNALPTMNDNTDTSK